MEGNDYLCRSWFKLLIRGSFPSIIAKAVFAKGRLFCVFLPKFAAKNWAQHNETGVSYRNARFLRSNALKRSHLIKYPRNIKERSRRKILQK